MFIQAGDRGGRKRGVDQFADEDGRTVFGWPYHIPVNGTLARIYSVAIAANGFEFSYAAVAANTVGTIAYARTNNANPELHTVLTAGNAIGGFRAYGSDGAAFQQACAILFNNDANGTIAAGIVPGFLSFYTADNAGVLNQALSIDKDSHVFLGTLTTGINGSATMQSAGVGGGTLWGATYGCFSANPNPMWIHFAKSRNTTLGSHTVIQAADQLGGMIFYGSDGAAWAFGGSMVFVADAAPIAGAVPGSLVQQWSDGTGAAFNSWLPRTRRLATLHTVSSTTATEVTGLSINGVPSGSYVVEWYLLVQSDTAGTGLTFSVNFSGTVTKMSAMCFWPDTGVTAALGAVDDAANVATGQIVAHSVTNTKATSTTNLSTGTTGVATATTTCLVRLTAMLDVSTAGDIELWHGSEAATATRIEVGSSVMCLKTA